MCNHTLTNKIIRTKKYDEEILVDFTYCEKCGEVLQGSVKFVKPLIIKKLPKKRKIRSTTKNSSITKEEAKKVVKKIKPKKEEKTLDKTPKKDFSNIPKKSNTDIRKTSRKPSAVKAPSGTTVSDIVRSKYNIKSEKKSITKEKKSKSTKMIDAYDNDLDNYNGINTIIK